MHTDETGRPAKLIHSASAAAVNRVLLSEFGGEVGLRRSHIRNDMCSCKGEEALKYDTTHNDVKIHTQNGNIQLHSIDSLVNSCVIQ